MKRTPVLATSAILLTVATAFTAFIAHQPHARPAPITLYDDMMQQRDDARARHLAAIDSSAMGRVLLLSAKNLSGNAALDSLLPRLDYQLELAQTASFASAIPRDTVRRLEAAADQTRNPTSTAMELARMMRATGAALAIRPVITMSGDSIMVSLYPYRDLSHTAAARPGSANLEAVAMPGLHARHANAAGVMQNSLRIMRGFALSLEHCDLDAHLLADAAPWCWTARGELKVVPGFSGRRVAERAPADRP